MSDDKPKVSEWIRAVLQTVIRDGVDFVFGLSNKRGEPQPGGWLSYAENFTCSSQEFYESVEGQIKIRKLPGVEIERIQFAEGGPISDQRCYLRLMRERLAIDICAAPFGTVFFFSCRVVHVPARIRLWHLAAAFGFFSLVSCLLVRPLGPAYAMIALIGLIFAIGAMMRNAGNAAFSDLDALLLKIPVLCTFYEDWFRQETYYRSDTRQLYLELLPSLVQGLAESACAAKGVKLIPHGQPSPILKELYKTLPPEKVN